MIKNYFKTGLRNLLKNKLSSLINICGLALGVGCCLVVFEMIDWTMNMDSFHNKLDKLFVIEKVSEEKGEKQFWGNTPAPLGPEIKESFSQVRNTARLTSSAVIFKQGDNVFRETVSFVDDSFYTMFNFPIKWGNAKYTPQENGIILTQELSEKLFGKTNAIGKQVKILFEINGEKRLEELTVNAVFDKRPIETSFYFSALLPFKKLISLGLNTSGDWSQSADITFVEAKNEKALLQINKEKKYLDLYNTANPDNKISAFHFQPLKSMNFHAYKVKNVSFNSSKPIGMMMLLVIGLSILLLVYFNYINIAIASASSRLKEIGVRKVIGSSRMQIIFQFILEHLIVCITAVAAGLVLAKFVFMPWFSEIANLELGQKLFTNYRTWLALLVLILLSALSGAAYPSIYISAFKPVSIVRGSLVIASNNRFRKALLGFQFFLTLLAISMAVAFNGEIKKIKEKPWGYKPEHNLVVTLNRLTGYEVIKAELENKKDIISVTGAVQSVGNFSKQILIGVSGNKSTVQSLNVLPGFLRQMGMKILKGRDLSDDYKSDVTSSVIVNQAFIKQMNWNSAIGKTIDYQNRKYTVIGEVSDFRYENFGAPVAPLVITGCKPEEVNYAYVKTDEIGIKNAIITIGKTWKKINPNLPFDFYYQDLVFNGYFNDFNNVSRVLSSSSFIMILISMSGVFGLALLILQKKMKDISVRKVLGAGISDISFQINKEFLYAILFAGLVGIPVSYWITEILFQQISPQSGVSFWPLILSFAVLIIITTISVSWHIIKAHTTNPAIYLKEE
ncbi:MAG: ABC transporter permease [Sphingobacteriaceae bacterium]